jgi:hypothetical protein
VPDLLCKNARYRHHAHPYYFKKYGGYCLECANAGVPDLIERIENWRAWVAKIIGFDHVATSKTDAHMRADIDAEIQRLLDSTDGGRP